MRKVIQVNLGGQAYQLEEEGYEALQRYLHSAEKQLEHNPDKDEILTDIERAVAAKAVAELKAGHTVLPIAAIKKAMHEVGPVESEQSAEAMATEPQVRRLYLLPKEGKISGVCAGLAAYFGMDATIMRVLFVLMLLITQGFWILVYILLAAVMPKADSAAQVAEAHGKPVTAQEIVSRIKRDVPVDSVQKVAQTVSVLARVASRIFAIASAVAIGLLTTFWGWALWAISFGQTALQGNLADFGRFEQLTFATALYIVILLPLLALFRFFERIARPAPEQGQNPSVLPVGVWIFWGITTVLLNGFVLASTDSVRANIRAHDGYLRVGSHAICINAPQCTSGAPQDNDSQHNNW